MRKCDRAKQKKDPPEKQCCPICLLPAGKGDRKTCSFFKRCAGLKFGESPATSDRLRSSHFRDYHADICEVCRQPREVCREQRIAAFKRLALKESKTGARPSAYISGEEVSDMLKKGCRRPPNEEKYTPVKADWYISGDGRSAT